MNAADLAIALLIAASVLIGVVRGLVVEVLSIAIWAGAVALALLFGGMVGDWFAASIELPSLRAALGHGLVFLAALVAGAILMWVLRKMVQGTGLSGTDRLLGLVFGLARGALLVTVLVVLAGLTALPRDPWWHQSRLIPVFQDIAQGLAPHLPAALREYIDFSEAPPAPAAAPAPTTT
jgi:membrane protein required for colicin V production